MDLTKFKKESGKTYVYVDSMSFPGKFTGRYIEVPYSYCDFTSLTVEQQLAICQCELRKDNLSVKLHELYIDADRFFCANCSSESFYIIKKTIARLEATFIESLTESEKSLIENLNVSYSNVELARVCGIVAEYADNKNYLLREQVELLEKNEDVDILYLISAKMNYLLSGSKTLNEQDIQLLGEIYDLCKEAPLSEELVKLCDKFTATISESDDTANSLKHHGIICDLLNLANNICIELDKDPKDSLRSSILNTMKKLRLI